MPVTRSCAYNKTRLLSESNKELPSGSRDQEEVIIIVLKEKLKKLLLSEFINSITTKVMLVIRSEHDSSLNMNKIIKIITKSLHEEVWVKRGIRP